MKKARRFSSRTGEAAQGCVLGMLIFSVLVMCGGFVVLFIRTAADGQAAGLPIAGNLPPTRGGLPAANMPPANLPPATLPTVSAGLPPRELGLPLFRHAATRTPFQPQTYTPTPSVTPTPTATATPTATPTATSTLTPLPTNTLVPTNTPIPTDTPIPPTPPPADGLPEEAWIGGVTGYAQSLPLSCEARSAVDWARTFGANIREMDFQNALPRTDNPNTGFVGDPRDERGSIPPESYGAHPPPVARLLSAYGVSAASRQGMTWQEVRREIAAGRPVIAWVVGNVWTGARAVPYTASDGETLLVVPFEHTVIVTGYTPALVSVVDNDLRYSVPLEDFLASWGVLGNLAVVKIP